MLKETIIVFIIFILLIILFRVFIKKNEKVVFVSIIVIIVSTTFINMYFLFRNYYPNFVLDGTTPLGDSRDNLLLYKADSEYNSEILFDILPTRNVQLASDSLFYNEFFSTYSGNVELIKLSTNAKSYIQNTLYFELICELPLVYMLDYSFSNNDGLDGDNTPKLFLNLNSLTRQKNLIAFSDEYKNLYLLSPDEYQNALLEADKQ